MVITTNKDAWKWNCAEAGRTTLELSDLQLAEDDPVNQLPHFIAVTSEVNLFLVSIFQRHLTAEMKYAVINHLETLQSEIIPDLIELLGELPTRVSTS